MSIQEPSLWQQFTGLFTHPAPVEVPLPINKVKRRHSDAKPTVLVACGSFNPPTVAHLRMFELAKDHLREHGGEVIAGYLSPVNDAYKKEGLLSADTRIQLLQDCTSSSDFLMVDEWEAKQPSAQRTYTVLQRIAGQLDKQITTEFETKLLCGSDLVESMLKPGCWIPEQIITLLAKHGIVCVARDIGNLEARLNADPTMAPFTDRIQIITDPHISNLSSSLVRQLIQQGKSIKYLVPNEVLNTIEEKKLYT